MPSKKLARILRSKSDFSQEEISRMTESEGWRWVYSQEPKKKPGIEICFTGFTAPEKRLLVELASNAGLNVVGSVTTRLRYLCCGEQPGLAKKKKAEEQDGVTLIDADQFRHLIQEGGSYT